MTAGALDSGYVWVVIVLLGAGTFAIRLSFIQLVEFVDEVPTRLEEAIQFVPVAVLTALVLPHFVSLDSTLAVTIVDKKLAAGVVAAIVAWRTESMPATIAIGMGVLWTLTLLL